MDRQHFPLRESDLAPDSGRSVARAALGTGFALGGLL